MVGTIMQLSRIFHRLYDKVIDWATKEQLLSDAVEVMACMEKNSLPFSFFNIIAHLMVCLVEESYIYGPVHTQWMYSFER